jgi:UDP-N-acetylglucosamine:LPS N-acetylglucosamine transferase
VVDFLDAFPWPMANIWRWFYLVQLRRFPESYEKSYQLFYRHPNLWAPFVRFERFLAGRRTLRWVRRHQPDVIVSTYSFATLVVGRLREEGRINVPAVNFLTDFGVHPRTVHPAIDMHLAIHPIAAAKARTFVDAPVHATGPAVNPAFAPDPEGRAKARAELGVTDEQRVVLVVSGSWGIGEGLEETVAALVRSGRFTVVTVCAGDANLQRRLEERQLGIVIGWTDEMPKLMAAADAVIENAGGLTSLEAFATGVPIVSYRPIPGHGRDNVRSMEQAGVTVVPDGEAALVEALDRLVHDTPERAAQLAAARSLFAEDPVDRIAELAERVTS